MTLITTVAKNMQEFTVREVKEAKAARQLMELLGHASSASMISILQQGINNCTVTPTAVRNAESIFGPSIPALKGKTNKKSSTQAGHTIAPRVYQPTQILAIDIMFVKQLPFLIGVLSPLGLAMCAHVKDRSIPVIAAALNDFVSSAKSRNFSISQIRTDGEGAVSALCTSLQHLGIVVDTAGPGQHVPVVERMVQTVKKAFRTHESNSPYTFSKILTIFCVCFCVSRINLQPSRVTMSPCSPHEQFTGIKLDQKRDLRVSFGQYVHATVPNTDNTTKPRTQGCIALLPTGNLTGSVKMWCLSTDRVVTRDQFVVLPMPDIVINHLDSIASAQGYSRYSEPDRSPPQSPNILPLTDTESVPLSTGVSMRDDEQSDQLMDQERRATEAVHVPSAIDTTPPAETSDHTETTDHSADAGADSDYADSDIPDADRGTIEHDDTTESDVGPYSHARPRRGRRGSTDSLQYLPAIRQHTVAIQTVIDEDRSELQRQLDLSSNWVDKSFAFNISVRAALREREAEARPVIMAELRQMHDKRVWHGVHVSTLTREQRRSIIRSSMFLKDKKLASGAFDKFKARLVAGGDQQDKSLYDNLSSPTAASASVFAVTAIAATEHRVVEVIDIGGAFLNVDMASTGVIVHMRLNSIMTEMMLTIDPSYSAYVEDRGTMVVALDRALYGCVEASALWYTDLRLNLLQYGFIANPYDSCVYNKQDPNGQITLVVHVDDILVTCVSQDSITLLGKYLTEVYKETKTHSGKVLDYIGMTFDFRVLGEVRVTMANCVGEILDGCGVTTTRATPATENLFDIRDTEKATDSEKKWFHTHVAKMLYLAKRVRPECLTSVSFLSTRVQCCDQDDIAKLRRLLGYLRYTRDRGIVLRIGDNMTVSAYIDAAYGVHQQSGKSHTGCAIVLGDAGPVYSKSCKQRIVTKSSTEAELVGLSDTATQAIHLRNFIVAQGYSVGPAVIFQDNMSTMALMKRGGPGSERSRHINIRYFWLSEKVASKEVTIEHLGTDDMFANILTKPVQGAQFIRERQGLTNWYV
jgi:hypothetical protein